MITREVTDEEVVALSTREESHFFDKKSSAVSGKGVQKIAVAFANADGGEFLIGIADDADAPNPEDRWQGVENIEELNSHLQALFALQPALDVRYEQNTGNTRVRSFILHNSLVYYYGFCWRHSAFASARSHYKSSTQSPFYPHLNTGRAAICPTAGCSFPRY